MNHVTFFIFANNAYYRRAKTDDYQKKLTRIDRLNEKFEGTRNATEFESNVVSTAQ